jgi:shikimate 5-dehydrogenase
LFIDLWYNQFKRLNKAEKKGCKILNGLGYVQFQRAAQIELWTGQKAPLDVMRKELKEIIREENEKAQTE